MDVDSLIILSLKYYCSESKKMKYTLHLNQVQLKEFGIRNINQAHILDLLMSASTWAEPIIVDDTVFYWVARSVIVDELWILDIKPDTVYRHLKKLEEFGVIDYVKQGKKDCIKVTKKGKKYLLKHYVGNESDKEQNSETDPIKLGNESENNSEIDPTYHNTTSNQNTKDNKQKKHQKATSFENFIDLLKSEFKKNKISTFSSKINQTTETKEAHSEIQKDNKKLSEQYAEYVKRNKNLSARLDKWLTAFFENNLSSLEYGNSQSSNNQESYDAVDDYFAQKSENYDDAFDVEEV